MGRLTTCEEIITAALILVALGVAVFSVLIGEFHGW